MSPNNLVSDEEKAKRRCNNCVLVVEWKTGGHGGYGYMCSQYTGKLTKNHCYAGVNSTTIEVWKQAATCENYCEANTYNE